jgi:hypothetical protein
MSRELQDFTRSRPVRAALARGLTRATFARAEAERGDLWGALAALLSKAPNRRARERTAARLARRPGVVRVAAGPDGEGLTVLLRRVERLTITPEPGTSFAETSLVDVRLTARPGRRRVCAGMGFLVFGAHAIARLVHRSNVPLGRDVLATLDAETAAAFRRMQAGALIEDGGRHALPAREPGLWCERLRWWTGEADAGWATAPEPSPGEVPVPVLFLRTFLGPGQMRPDLRLRWEDMLAGAAAGVVTGG